MMRYARIENGSVAELIDTDLDMATLYPPELVWVPAGPQVQQGWVYAAGTLSAPPPPVFDPQQGPLADLGSRIDRLQDVITRMQADYMAAGDQPSAVACKTAKAQLQTVPADPTVTAATTRGAFRSAVRTLLQNIAQQAPPAVADQIKQAAQGA